MSVDKLSKLEHSAWLCALLQLCPTQWSREDVVNQKVH